MTKPRLSSADLQAFIDRHQIQAQLIELPVPTPTVESAAIAVGVQPEQIVKSLLFWVDAEPILAVACGPTRVDRRALASKFDVGRKRVKLIPAVDVVEISGYLVGAVPPFGHLTKLATLMDERVLQDREVYAGGGGENVLMRVSPREIQRVTQASIVNLQTLDTDS
jgi:prolyl-tRNA editing enzyme YbaK/EbsC (Cys-tRNA(Pro) deacylase)